MKLKSKALLITSLCLGSVTAFAQEFTAPYGYASATEAPTPVKSGAETLTMSHIYAVQVDGHRLPEADQRCQTHYGSWLSSTVDAHYEVNTIRNWLSASMEFSAAPGDKVNMAAEGLRGRYSMISPSLPDSLKSMGVRIVTSSLDRSTSHINVNVLFKSNSDFNCVVSTESYKTY